MNTSLIFILLISVTAIILIDAGCGPRPDISNAVFTDNESCNDIKITCENGYQMHQLLSCVDDQWTYQEPNCAPVEVKCQYNFTRGLIIIPVTTQTATNNIDECKENCDNDEECGTFETVPDQGEGGNKVVCIKYPRLVLRWLVDTNLTQCIEECNKEEDCITLSVGFAACFLFNLTLSNVEEDDKYSLGELDVGTTGEKLC